jgi:two-component system LytT family response regulator
MTKLKAIIVDDEEGARSVLTNLLTRSSPEIEILCQCENVPEAVKAINKFQPDVVFLDVEMPDYAGYELVHFFDEVNFKIIFVTAYDQYAIKAFELSAVDYLLKPINRLRLKEAVDKLKEQLGGKKIAEDYQVLLESIQEKEFQKIVISEVGSKKVLLLNDIIAIEAQRSYSCIHLVGGKQMTVSKNLRHFESVLPEGNRFFRCHKSWIVNLSKIESFSKANKTISLEGKLEAKLSKVKFEEFEKIAFN